MLPFAPWSISAAHSNLGLPNCLVELPGMPFELPVDGLDIPDLEGEGMEEMKHLYNLKLVDFNRALQFKVQIKWLIVQAILRQYIAILRRPLMQFTNVTPAAILAHMVSTCGRIQAQDLECNIVTIARPWNPDTAIKTVFDQGALCRKLAA